MLLRPAAFAAPALLGLAAALASLVAPAPAKSGAKIKLQGALISLEGQIVELGQNDQGRTRAFVFLYTGCPVANGSIQTLNALHKELGGKGVDIYGVTPGWMETRASFRRHYQDYKLNIPVLYDSSGLLVAALKPTHYPEAIVLNPDSEVIYRGAIDNAYSALGKRRIKTSENYLRDALLASLNKKKPARTTTSVVGCYLEPPLATDPRTKVTYTKDIAPLIMTRCLDCHREGQAAPFSLATYSDAAKRAKQISRVVHDKVMPPWIPDLGDKRLMNERWLTPDEISLFRQWDAQGRLKGDEGDLPPTPQFAEGWQLGQPDLIVKMTEPFKVPAAGPDILQNFVIPVSVPEDRLVAAIEFLPGNKKVAHHAVIFLDNSGAARKLDAATPEPGYSQFGGPGFLPSGALGGWSVGNSPRRLPGNRGRLLKKGSDIVVQMHYHPIGKEEVDQSTIGIYFVDKTAPPPDTAQEVASFWISNYEIDIPPGEDSYRRGASYVIPKDILMVGAVPHMHLLGKSMKVTAQLPKGEERVILNISRWNYNWQDEYYFQRPFWLPAGTVLKADAAFDNTEDNPLNPNDPPKRVTWGDGTNDEMLFCFFLFSAKSVEDVIHVVIDNIYHDAAQPRGGR